MRVVVPPVLVEGMVCRVVISADSVYETQEWTGSDWLPSGALLSTVSGATRASGAQLAALGVPTADAVLVPDRIVLRASDLVLVAMLADAERTALRPPVRPALGAGDRTVRGAPCSHS